MSSIATELASHIDDLMTRAQADLAAAVSFESIHLDPARTAQCRASADWVAARFTELHLNATVHDTVDGSFAVIATRDGDPGAPRVLLYAHHDVQPTGDESLWQSPPFELTERDGRWYGRGSADCKGSIIVHLTALRALDRVGDRRVALTVVIEGSEEHGGEGLETLAVQRPELFDADLILICDTGNTAVGIPTLTTSLRGAVNVQVEVTTLEAAVHSGQFGGAAPDALAALIAGLGTLRNAAGDTVIDGITTSQSWPGAPYSARQFREDSTQIAGTEVLGSGAPADMVWARPAITVLGIDAPATATAANAIVPTAAAALNVRYPAGITSDEILTALEEQLRAAIPWGATVSISASPPGAAFSASTKGPGYRALAAAMETAYGREVVYSGMGGSIPLATVLQETHPEAEIALLGICEPKSQIHAANESVDPAEIRNTALSEALLLHEFGR